MIARPRNLGVAFVAALGVLAVGLSQAAERTAGLRPTVFAIRGARVVPEAGRVIQTATVVIRDGLIEAVGPDVAVPADAQVIEGQGLTVYPGFIDASSSWGFDSTLRRSEGGAAAVEDLASEALAATKADNRKGLTPEFAVSSALKLDEDQADAWHKQGFAAHLVAPEGGFVSGQSALVSLSGLPSRESIIRSPVALHAALRTIGGGDYPRSLMGVFAHVRQTFLDAGYEQRRGLAFEQAKRSGRRPPLDPALSALTSSLDGRLPVVFEADTTDAIHHALDFAAEFKLRPMIFGGRDAGRVVERLAREHVPVLLRLNFPESAEKVKPLAGGPFYESHETLEEKPLPKRVLDERQRLLQREIETAAVLHRAGVIFAFSGQGLEKPEKFSEKLRKVIEAGLPPDAALKALTLDAARLFGVDRQIGTITAGKAAHLLVTDGDFQLPETQVRHLFADGVHFAYEPKEKPAAKAKDAKPAEKKEEKAKEAEKKLAVDPKTPDPASEIEADRTPRLRTGGSVLFRNAILLPVSGTPMPASDLLVLDGKISRLGRGLTAPDGVVVLDADGMFIMPGIVDTHCHFALGGGVNELSLSIVPEVRVRDVIESEDVQIYRALAGGVTTARLLHGSANVVGGQDAVIKLKYGKPPSELLLADAPRGVKFALGENVKRGSGRFPNSRLGVEAVLVRAFTEAREYQKEKARQAQSKGPEVRRDLRLEALADVLDGALKVHCHCYRADEILMLLRVADQFGFKVKSLQHVLEGYKIAAEIAAHGASCSTFADWWAYKIEAFDAIPFNSALLTEAGTLVCLKSDSNELMRHLYQEAAKCLKYGGMSEAEALKTITINGAKQLGLKKRIGSLDVGKDADLAIFNGHPLNSYSRVEMTLVEGEIYFQRSDRLQPAAYATAAPTRPAAQLAAIVPSPTRSYLLRGVNVHSNRPGQTELLIVDGRIAPTPWSAEQLRGAQVLDLAGQGIHVYPGMIDSGTIVGLTELGSASETHDFNEGGDFQPDLRASTAINADSELIPVTRANGVLSVVTRPTGAVIAGQSALINLAGWVPREMTVVDPLALQVDFPTLSALITGDPTMPVVGRAVAKKQREEKIRRLKELFKQARVYDGARKQLPNTPVNPRLEALIPYVLGTKPVIIQAYRQQELLDALKLADELKLRVILSGAIDAWKIADQLKKRDVPVLLGPVMTMPQEHYDPYDGPYACAAKLHHAGVRFAIRSSGGSNSRNLPYEAAMAVSYGLPPAEGLKAVTQYPAEILGVGDQLGTIEPGKRANLVLTDGDPLQASTRVLALFIDGRPWEPASKQTRLYERYRTRLHEVRGK